MICQATFSESSVRRCRRHYTSLFLAPILLITSITYAAKTDVVELANGDHITGEVTEVQLGKLVFKTDDIGTLSIEWIKVAHLSSKQHFEIEMSSGRRYFGKLAKGANEGMLLVVDDDLSTTTEIPIVDAIRVAVFHESGPLSDRLDGSFDFGYSHTKSTESTQLSFDFGLRHRDQIRMWDLSGSALQSETSAASSDSATLTGEHRRFFGDRWFWSGVLQLQQNDELGLDLRKLIGGGVGRYFIQSDVQELGLLAGVGWSNEDLQVGQTFSSTELIFGLTYDVFLFDSPKVDFSTQLIVFPSLTVSGRVRVNADVSLRYEIVKDLFAELSLTDQSDNKPWFGEVEKHDYTIITSLGYSF